MAFRVEVSPEAFGDLDAIAAYIRRRGSYESAERWFNDEIFAGQKGKIWEATDAHRWTPIGKGRVRKRILGDFRLPKRQDIGGLRMHTDGHGLEKAGSENELTESVIGAAFEIANVLGAGFLEKVYERAFLRELALRGLGAEVSGFLPGLLQRTVYWRLCGGSACGE